MHCVDYNLLSSSFPQHSNKVSPKTSKDQDSLIIPTKRSKSKCSSQSPFKKDHQNVRRVVLIDGKLTSSTKTHILSLWRHIDNLKRIFCNYEAERKRRGNAKALQYGNCAECHKTTRAQVQTTSTFPTRGRLTSCCRCGLPF